MPSKNVLPMLTEEGWNTDTLSVLDTLISHFYASDYSQTYIYKDNVASLAYLIYKYNHDFSEMKNQILSTLNAYLSRYFNNIDVICDIKRENEDTAKYILLLSCVVIEDDGTEISVAKAIRIENGKLKKITDVNNNG